MKTFFIATLATAGLALSASTLLSSSEAAQLPRKHFLSGTMQAAPVPGAVTDTDSSDPALAQAATYGRMIWPQSGSYAGNGGATRSTKVPTPTRRFLSGTIQAAPAPGAVTDTDSSDPALAQAASYGRMIWPQRGAYGEGSGQ